MHDGKVRRFIGSENGFKEDASPGLQAMEMVLQRDNPLAQRGIFRKSQLSRIP
jgi:hypothetical protein